MFLVSGYVAEEPHWKTFSRRWAEEVLNPYPSIPYLHMVDIVRPEWRERNGIYKEQAFQKIDSAVELLVSDRDIEGFIGYQSEEYWKRVVRNWNSSGISIKNHEVFPDYNCHTAYIFSVLNEIRSRDASVENVTFYVERKKYVSHYLQNSIQDSIKQFLEKENPELAKIMGEIIPLDPDIHLPLQAADVICWFSRRAFDGTIPDELKRNHDLLKERGLIGMGLDNKNLDQLERACALRVKQMQSVNEADRFADMVSKILQVPKSEIMKDMQKTDKNLKAEKKKKPKES